MAQEHVDIYLNGKYVHGGKEKLPADAKLTRKVREDYYETPEYAKQQSINASNYFSRQAEIREDMEKYHG